VFASLYKDDRNIPVGIQRNLNGKGIVKVDGEAVNSSASLAEYIPVQLIDSQTFLLLEGAPKYRRQFMDWLVFHVKPQFLGAWKNAQRCIKHRNSLLRHGNIDRLLLAPWDKELIKATDEIDQLRTEIFNYFLTKFSDLVTDFVVLESLTLKYFRGWDSSRDFPTVLDGNFNTDFKQGFTSSGPHRADLRIKLGGIDAAELLSRGQQKLLVCALKIAQGLVFQELTGRQCIYLVDDLPAELDEVNRKKLTHWLAEMGAQVFITGVDEKVLVDSWPKELSSLDYGMFHVEQGRVTTANQEDG
jgi:DNA replication and repair protein RecF